MTFSEDYGFLIAGLILGLIFIFISYLGHLELIANGPPLMIQDDPTIGFGLYGLGT